MGEPVGLSRHEDVGDDVEDGETAPQGEVKLDPSLAGDRVDDPAEQDRLEDGDAGQRHVGEDDGADAPAVDAEICEGAEVDTGKGHGRPSSRELFEH
ncbi:hypothetical protein D3C87_1760120 [compost metagenome]